MAVAMISSTRVNPRMFGVFCIVLRKNGREGAICIENYCGL
jgi:hypothetical protein